MPRLSEEERNLQNATFRKYGYYWSKPRRTDGWKLLDRRGIPVPSPDKLYQDIQADPDKYERAGKQARISAIQAARRFIEQGILILDTETTGAGGAYEEVIELAILDKEGDVLFHSLIQCDVPIHPQATEKHGITNEMLQASPQFPQVWPQAFNLLHNRHVAAFNIDFDTRILTEEAEHYQLAVPAYTPHDLMRMYMAVVDFGKPNLQTACEHFGIELPSHRGVSDAEATRQLLLKLASQEGEEE